MNAKITKKNVDSSNVECLVNLEILKWKMRKFLPNILTFLEIPTKYFMVDMKKIIMTSVKQ